MHDVVHQVLPARNSLARSLALIGLLLAGCGTQPDYSSALPTPAALSGVTECMAAVSGVPPQAGTPPIGANGFRVVNWNIQKGGNPAWAADLAALGPAADLIILQEASPDLNAISGLEDRFHVSFAEGYRAFGLQTGVITLSRAAPLAECALRAHEPWLGTPKATLVSRYALEATERTLLVINLHGVNFSFGARKLAEQISIVEAIITVHDGPVVLSGDFNTWRTGRVRLLSAAAERLGLEAVDYEHDWRKRVFGLPLDHIYTRGLEPSEATSYDLESSDHNPMVVRLHLAPDAGFSAAGTP